MSQILPTGASYSLAWNSAGSTSTNVFTNYNPLLSSNVSFNVTQPLLRNRSDRPRTASSSDISQQAARCARTCRSTRRAITTVRNVKNAYWDLASARENLQAQQQSLDLAKRALADNEKRVQIGTMAPIDIVEAQSEVARNDEAVIVAEADIKQAEDRLRALDVRSEHPDFWTTVHRTD